MWFCCSAVDCTLLLPVLQIWGLVWNVHPKRCDTFHRMKQRVEPHFHTQPCLYTMMGAFSFALQPDTTSDLGREIVTPVD